MLRALASISQLYRRCQMPILFCHHNRFVFSQQFPKDQSKKKKRRRDLFELSPKSNALSSKIEQVCNNKKYSQGKLSSIYNPNKQMVNKQDYALYFYEIGKLIKNSNFQVTEALTRTIHRTIAILTNEPQKVDYLSSQILASYLFFMLYHLLHRAPHEIAHFEYAFRLLFEKQFKSWRAVIKLLYPNLIEEVRTQKLEALSLNKFYHDFDQMYPEAIPQNSEEHDNSHFQTEIHLKKHKLKAKKKKDKSKDEAKKQKANKNKVKAQAKSNQTQTIAANEAKIAKKQQIVSALKKYKSKNLASFQKLKQFITRYNKQNPIIMQLEGMTLSNKINNRHQLEQNINAFLEQFTSAKLSSLAVQDIQIITAFVHLLSSGLSMPSIKTTDICLQLFNIVLSQIKNQDALPYNSKDILQLWTEVSKFQNQDDLQEQIKPNLKNYIAYLAKHEKSNLLAKNENSNFTNLLEPIIANSYFKRADEEYLDIKIIDEVFMNETNQYICTIEDLFTLYLLNPKAIDYIPFTLNGEDKLKDFACIAIMIAYQLKEKQNYSGFRSTCDQITAEITSDGTYGYVKLLQQFEYANQTICELLIKYYGLIYFTKNSSKYVSAIKQYELDDKYKEHLILLFKYYPSEHGFIDELRNGITFDYHLFKLLTQKVGSRSCNISVNLINNMVRINKLIEYSFYQPILKLYQTQKHRKLLSQSLFQQLFLGGWINAYFQGHLKYGDLIRYFCDPSNRSHFKIWAINIQHLIIQACKAQEEQAEINKTKDEQAEGNKTKEKQAEANKIKEKQALSFLISHYIDSKLYFKKLTYQQLSSYPLSQFDLKLLSIAANKPETIFEDDQHQFENAVLIIKSKDLYAKHKKLLFQYLSPSNIKSLSIFSLQKLLLHCEVDENDFDNVLRQLWEQYFNKISKNNFAYLSFVNIFKKMTDYQGNYTSSSYARFFFRKILQFSDQYGEDKLDYIIYDDFFIKRLDKCMKEADVYEELNAMEVAYLRKVKNNIFSSKNYANFFSLSQYEFYYQVNSAVNEKQYDELLWYLKQHIETGTNTESNLRTLLMSFVLNHKNLSQSFNSKFLPEIYQTFINNKLKMSYLLTNYLTREFKIIALKYNPKIKEISQNYNGLTVMINPASYQSINEKLEIKLIQKKIEGLIYYEYINNIIIFIIDRQKPNQIEKRAIKQIYSFALNEPASKIHLIELERTENGFFSDKSKSSILNFLKKLCPNDSQASIQSHQKPLTLTYSAAALINKKKQEIQMQKKRNKEEESIYRKTRY